MTRPGVPDVSVGVVGVGSMGRHHARVYSELPGVTLSGVADIDEERARAVARDYGTHALATEELLDTVDAVSVAVPTASHYETVKTYLEGDVHVLVENPFVENRERGRELAAIAEQRDLVLQVGYIERFNPATRALADIVPDLDVVSVDVERRIPPLAGDSSDSGSNGDSVVTDLIVHDLDILLSLVDAEVDSLSAAAHDGRHASVQFQFDDGSVAALTASRLTQKTVRRLSITALTCRVEVDFVGQTVEIHRPVADPVQSNADGRYRHESVVERPAVENGEPLTAELESFTESVRDGTEPVVTAEDGLRVLELAERIELRALRSPIEVS